MRLAAICAAVERAVNDATPSRAAPRPGTRARPVAARLSLLNAPAASAFKNTCTALRTVNGVLGFTQGRCKERMGSAMRPTGLRPFRGLAAAILVSVLQGGCGGGGGDGNDVMPPPDLTGDAVLEIQLVDGGRTSTPPPPPAGFRLLNIDLNEGSGGNYIWLYYRTGKADGSEGQPISRIYTVDEHDGETAQDGVKLPVDLNAGSRFVGGVPLWLYVVKADRPVARCIVVDNRSSGSTGKRVYAPPEAAGKYPIEWVRELKPDSLSQPFDDLPFDAQDLNEDESFLPFFVSDYIYIGYCRD